MGNCNSVISVTGTPELLRSRELDKCIRADEKQLSKEARLLLLGAGDSGKSTMLKSMRIIHSVHFAPLEIEHFRRLIFTNLIDGIRSVLDFMEDSNLRFANEENIKNIPFIVARIELSGDECYPTEYYQILRQLWEDGNVKKAIEDGHQAAIPENLSYYFSHLDRLFGEDFVPTNQDILHCRNKTTGISETQFPVKDRIYRIFDVGGQRSERKKWIHCFENVTAVFFIVAISGYDCCLSEDRESNQMQESLNLFGSICNSPWFTRTSMILFLNKMDIFKQRIEKSPIRTHFPDFQGPEGDLEKAKIFFKSKFLRLNRSKTKEIYANYTNATDTDLLKVVMSSVNDIILSNNMRGGGLL